MVYAAGILIISIFNGKLYTLLGQDHYNTYSDFGGKNDLCDKNQHLLTASREAYEETCGSVYSYSEFSNKLINCDIISALSFTNKPYHMYMLFIKYDPDIPHKFEYIYNYIRNIKHMNQFHEKKQLKWFLLDDVLNHKVCLRNIFQRTINEHKNSILKIAYKYITTNTYYNYGRLKI